MLVNARELLTGSPTMTLAIQQGYAEFSLELLDRLAERGLGGEHHFGGLGKAAPAHDFDESAKGSKIHSILYQNILQSQNSFSSCPAAT
jgi:hypothetical protein